MSDLCQSFSKKLKMIGTIISAFNPSASTLGKIGIPVEFVVMMGFGVLES